MIKAGDCVKCGPVKVSPTICARWGTGGNNAPVVLCFSNEWLVRRLTPLECGRLQGFPDWWLSDLETPDPTEDELDFWDDVFEGVSTGRHKGEDQEDERSDH